MATKNQDSTETEPVEIESAEEIEDDEEVEKLQAMMLKMQAARGRYPLRRWRTG